MELNDVELKALARIRIKNHKDLSWNRKYTVPMYSMFTVGTILALFLPEFTKEIQPYVCLLVIVLLLGALITRTQWAKKIRQPYINKFIQYWKDHKELMD